MVSAFVDGESTSVALAMTIVKKCSKSAVPMRLHMSSEQSGSMVEDSSKRRLGRKEVGRCSFCGPNLDDITGIRLPESGISEYSVHLAVPASDAR